MGIGNAEVHATAQSDPPCAVTHPEVARDHHNLVPPHVSLSALSAFQKRKPRFLQRPSSYTNTETTERGADETKGAEADRSNLGEKVQREATEEEVPPFFDGGGYVCWRDIAAIWTVGPVSPSKVEIFLHTVNFGGWMRRQERGILFGTEGDAVCFYWQLEWE
ncbi:hypothetical protein K439DRAFT_1510513 [Ramaria rubella]|nr:hypothetical protein K439DRAFT_1510513 [Ramaria rubella]